MSTTTTPNQEVIAKAAQSRYHDQFTAQLRQARKERKSVRFSIQLQNTIEDLWPVLSDNEALQRLASFDAPTDVKFVNEGFGNLLQAAAKLPGTSVIYREAPFEWHEHRFHSVEKLFEGGPLRYIHGQMHFSNEQGRTLVEATFWYVARYKLLPGSLLVNQVAGKVKKALKQVDQTLTASRATSKMGSNAFALTDELRHNIRELTASFNGLGFEKRGSAALAEYILTNPEHRVRKLRPYELANRFELDSEATLNSFLEGARVGFFDLSWDIICPSCNGAAEKTSSLNALAAEVHCEACNIDFDASFDENVEVSFKPAAKIRVIDDLVFCPASPQNYKHVIAQQFALPRENISYRPQLEKGEYFLRLAGETHRLILEVSEDGEPQLNLDIEDLQNRDRVSLHPEGEILLKNHTVQIKTLRIERSLKTADMVTANVVTTRQRFRDLFGSEVLRPNVKLGVKNLAVMFSDLKDSTALYQQEGDARAFDLVQEHFELLTAIVDKNRGAVVKTIGDSIMAVFTEPRNAVQAATEALQTFMAFEKRGTSLQLKLGVHKGPCIALTLNERLDYFGSTVNKAARLQQVARTHELVISEDVLNDAAVRNLLSKPISGVKLFSRKAELRGIEKETRVYPVRLAE